MRPPPLSVLMLALFLAHLFTSVPQACAQVQSGRELVRLNPANLVHDISINSTVATTITFPEKVTLLTGFGLVTEPNAAQSMAQSKVALVHYENVLGDTLVVRLVKSGDPCYATIRTTRSIYLMRFTPSLEANLAVIVSPPVEKNAAVEVTQERVVQSRIQFSSEELVGMLSKARNRKALQPLNPGLYSGWQERNNLEMSATDENQMSATIYEIQRQPERDLTVFRAWVMNNGPKNYEFDPSSVKVRVGQRSYDAQLVDSATEVLPGQRIAMDLVLQGGPGGSREGLSIDQDFRLELPAPGRRQIDPTLFGDAGSDLLGSK